jgi:hypothetical protein
VEEYSWEYLSEIEYAGHWLGYGGPEKEITYVD